TVLPVGVVAGAALDSISAAAKSCAAANATLVSKTRGNGRAIQQLAIDAPVNRLHLVCVDEKGVARLKLRPRYQLNGDQQVIRADGAPTYDAPPTIDDLYRRFRHWWPSSPGGLCVQIERSHPRRVERGAPHGREVGSYADAA